MAWRYAAAEQGIRQIIGEVIIGAGCAVWLVLISLFIIRSFCFPKNDRRVPSSGRQRVLQPVTGNYCSGGDGADTILPAVFHRDYFPSAQ